jgi:DnaJ-domain-containing protein 1
MSLDHDSGTMTGTVLRGQFAGMRLEELGRADLLALLRECRAADEESARLIEAYLDRADPDWHEDFAGARSEYRAAPGGPDVTVEEAYAILGLAPGADAAAIRAAHRRLMKQLHPDHGGTDYLATKINRARDVLLHR